MIACCPDHPPLPPPKKKKKEKEKIVKQRQAWAWAWALVGDGAQVYLHMGNFGPFNSRQLLKKPTLIC